MIVRHLFRHTFKSRGREALQRVSLGAGDFMPCEMVRAISQGAFEAAREASAPCMHFSRGSKALALRTIRAVLKQTTEEATLSPTDRPDIPLHPKKATTRSVDVAMPIAPKDRARPARAMRPPYRGVNHSVGAPVTLCNLATHRAVEEQMLKPLAIHRRHSNTRFFGDGRWGKRVWRDTKVAVGKAAPHLRDNARRCLSTTATHDTGRCYMDTLGLPEHPGHRGASLRAEVMRSSRIAPGGQVRVS
jgi:uncharacterized protein YcbX